MSFLPVPLADPETARNGSDLATAIQTLRAGRTPRQGLPLAAEVYLLETGHLQHRYDARLYSVAYGWWKRRETIRREVLLATRGLARPEVVEVGCHKGADLLQFAKDLGPRGRFLGVDISQEFVSFAANWASIREVPGARWAVADAQALPSPDAGFDVLISTEMVEHIPGPERTVAEFARVLRPGGTAILSTVNPATSAARVGKWIDRFLGGRLRTAVVKDMDPQHHDHDHGHEGHAAQENGPGYSETAEFGTRDPGHVAELPLKDWRRLLGNAGFESVRTVPGSIVYGAPFFDRHRALFACMLLAESSLQRLPWFHGFCQAGTLVAKRARS